MLARTRNMLWVIDHLRIKQLRKANLGEITAAVIHPVDTHRAELELQQYGVRFESVSSFDPLPWERSTYCKSEPAAPNPEKARGESQSKRSRERDTTVWKKEEEREATGPVIPFNFRFPLPLLSPQNHSPRARRAHARPSQLPRPEPESVPPPCAPNQPM